MSGSNRFFTGFFKGTGAALAVEACGFKPRYVRVVNLNSTPTGSGEYIAPMEDIGSAYAGGVTMDALGVPTLMTAAEGITPTANGFSVGTDSTVNESGELHMYICTD